MKHLKHITASLSVTFFKERDQFVAFSPALDLSTCGKTFQEARERFAEAADLFIEETVKMGTSEEVLQTQNL
jgi:predicted RNase H-like HicB family nuclease